MMIMKMMVIKKQKKTNRKESDRKSETWGYFGNFKS